MARVVDLGIEIGILPSGPTRSIADVPGVGVGHATVWREAAPPPDGQGVARTGVTAGSCIVIVVTDAPLDSAACACLARRAGLGLARTGSTGDHGSGEIFMAMATGLRGPRADGRGTEAARAERPAPLRGRELDPLFAAVVEATEEAVLNSMLAAPTVTGRNGNTSYGLPAEAVGELPADRRLGRQRDAH